MKAKFCVFAFSETAGRLHQLGPGQLVEAGEGGVEALQLLPGLTGLILRAGHSVQVSGQVTTSSAFNIFPYQRSSNFTLMLSDSLQFTFLQEGHWVSKSINVKI